MIVVTSSLFRNQVPKRLKAPCRRCLLSFTVNANLKLIQRFKTFNNKRNKFETNTVTRRSRGDILQSLPDDDGPWRHRAL